MLGKFNVHDKESDSPGEVKNLESVLIKMRKLLKVRHYSEKTVISYCKRVNQFLKKYQGKDGGNPKNINSFLTYLAVESKVSASPQNQALASLLFYFRFVK